MDACASCGTERLSISYKYCRSCGRQFAAESQAIPVGPRTRWLKSLIAANRPPTNSGESQRWRTTKIDWHCPNCGSEQCQKLSMVYAAGTSLSLGIGRGYFSGGGSVTA